MQGRSRYLIGIDLGTTNCAVAYVDTMEEGNGSNASLIRRFEVAQLAHPGEVRTLPLLPSCLYFPTDDEICSGAVNLPWQERPIAIVGTMARDEGSVVLCRQVSAAKCWVVACVI